MEIIHGNETNFNDMIQDEIKNNIELPKYNCVITYYDNGRVKSVTFNQ